MGEPDRLATNAAATMAKLRDETRRVLDFVAIERSLPQATAAGTRIGSTFVASWCGLSVRAVRRALGTLVDAQVLERVSPAAGSTGAVYRVAPISTWLVEWSVHPELRDRRLAELADVSRGTTPNPGVVRAPKRAQMEIARARVREQRKRSSRTGARTTESDVRAPAREQTQIGDRGAPLPSGESSSLPATSTSSEAVRKLIATVQTRAGARVWGSFLTRLTTAAHEAGDDRIDELSAAARSVPEHAPLMVFIGAIEDALRPLDVDDGTRSRRPWEPRPSCGNPECNNGWTLDDNGSAHPCPQCETRDMTEVSS